MSASTASRDFSEEIRIDATRNRVWEILSDPRTMPQASPELFALTRRRGPFAVGERFVGWNRRKGIVWPTISRILSVSPGHELSWLTSSSGAVWTYTLTEQDGATVLRETRQMPGGAPRFATMFGDALLGGMANHADELETHVSTTLAWIKERAET